MKKILVFLTLTLLTSSLCGCNLFVNFEDTPETDAAFAAYEAAIKQSIAHDSGEILITTKNTDSIEGTETNGTIDYTYSIDEEGRVSFERVDYTNGEKVASYYGDGQSAYELDMETGKWLDATEALKPFLDRDQNTMNTLALFRIDSNFKYNKRFYESIKRTESDGDQVITVELKSSEITDMMSYSDEREIQREMASQTRSYYVNQSGDIYKIVVDSVQNVLYKGDPGVLSSVMTVDIKY